MREILSIQVGQGGNQIGAEFWKIIGQEHGIDPTGGHIDGSQQLQYERRSVYFRETEGQTHVPRAILVDLEPSTLNSLRTGPLGRMFPAENFVFNQQSGTGSKGNYATVYYGEGAKLEEAVMDAIRKESETCDSLQGFQLAHALGGGTGSGLGSLLITNICEEYPDRIMTTYSVFPSKEASENGMVPYDAVLSIDALVDSVDVTYCFDNEALYDMCSRTLEPTAPTYGDLNRLVSLTMSGITTCLRFPDQSNADLFKFAKNMVDTLPYPDPRLHFFTPGFAPLATITRDGDHQQRPSSSPTVSELITQAFDPDNTMVACDLRQGRYLTAAVILRGQVSTQEVAQQVVDMRTEDSPHFTEWMPDNVKTAVCGVPVPGLDTSATSVSNSSSIHHMIKRIHDLFLTKYYHHDHRMTFLRMYLDEGMDANEIHCAEANVSDLVSDYLQRDEEWQESFEFEDQNE